ncbi:MAG: endonuclease [Chloroflexota bacterium]|nr:endonuclease [Chloroflexota bacterium]
MVYLIHFDTPLGDLDNPRGQAQHYLGYADDLEARLESHRSGNGSVPHSALYVRSTG